MKTSAAWSGVALAYGLGAMAQVTASAAAAAPGKLEADIVRTRYGVPHVTAASYLGLGYGSGYAFAEDNVCLLADQIVTVSGERSKYFGPEATTIVSFRTTRNLDSDIYFKALLDGAELRKAALASAPEFRDLARGFVAGYNRYLRTTSADKLPAACRNTPWVRPMTLTDLLRLYEEKMTMISSGAFLAGVVEAAPPGAAAPAAPSATATRDPGDDDVGFGSNGWAFGRAATGGAGVLLANPHFPWLTTNRFYQIHQTIPGRLDVMGVSLSGLPIVSIGFNHDIAWTHTVSTDTHFTLYQLALDPSDPTAYLVDGRRVKMTTKRVTVEVKGGPSVQRTVYGSVYGPIVSRAQAGLGWTRAHAYAIADADRLNLRAAGVWLAIDRARSVGEIRHAVDASLGVPWVNTIAADRNGDVLYADVTATPNVDAAQMKRCAPSGDVPAGVAARLFVLDGSRSACRWTVDKAAPVKGLMPADAMPKTIRTDFVANSNDSYWLANDGSPQIGYAPIVGLTNEPQNLRTRAGLIEIHEALASGGPAPITPAKVEQMIFAERNYAAEIALDDVLAVCAAHPAGVAASGRSVDLIPACGVLAKWDRRMNLDSRGAALFVELWAALDRGPDLYAVPFDPHDPVHTPRGLKRDDAAAATITKALAQAVTVLGEEGVALDAPWGSVQVAVRGETRIPLHGGPGLDGVLDAQQAAWVQGVGYVPFHGSSYMQVVTFDASGPVADGLLSYSQSTDPASPHSADQTWLYSKKEWSRLPFAPADIKAQEISHEHIAEAAR